MTLAFYSCCHQLGHNICACSDAHERLDHRVELFLRSCQRTQVCSPAPESGSGYKDARKSFPSSAPSCCALKAFLPRTETLHQNSASYCRVRSFTRYFTSLGDSTEKLYCTHSSPATSQRPFLMPSSHGNNGMEHFGVAAAAPASHVDDSESGTSPPGLAADEGR